MVNVCARKTLLQNEIYYFQHPRPPVGGVVVLAGKLELPAPRDPCSIIATIVITAVVIKRRKI